jgi:predicted aspartyl protease
MHIRKAEFKLALPHLEAMAAHRPESRSLLAGQNLFAHFAGYPEQTVDRFQPSTLVYTMVDGNLFMPAKINGIPAECMVDSGAGISLITESEAKRLGIDHQAEPGGPKLYAADGNQTRYRVGIASQFETGGFRIANVAFLVLEDHQLQFAGGRQLALGLPVLLAFRTLAWRADGKLSIGLPGGKRDLGQANLCFDSGDLAAEVSVCGKKIIFLVDTGSGATLLWPPFAKEFTQVIRQSGAIGSTPLHGVSGTAEISSLTLPALKLEIAGFVAELRPAHVLTEPTTPNSQWLSGRLGVDALNQADSVLLDFHAMKLSLNCISQ